MNLQEASREISVEGKQKCDLFDKQITRIVASAVRRIDPSSALRGIVEGEFDEDEYNLRLQASSCLIGGLSRAVIRTLKERFLGPLPWAIAGSGQVLLRYISFSGEEVVIPGIREAIISGKPLSSGSRVSKVNSIMFDSVSGDRVVLIQPTGIIWRETDGRLFSGVIAGAATNPPQLLTPERMLTIDILPPELRGLTFPQIAGLYDRYLPIEVDLKKLDLKI